jgi:hypothetical protein
MSGAFKSLYSIWSVAKFPNPKYSLNDLRSDLYIRIQLKRERQEERESASVTERHSMYYRETDQ